MQIHQISDLIAWRGFAPPTLLLDLLPAVPRFTGCQGFLAPELFGARCENQVDRTYKMELANETPVGRLNEECGCQLGCVLVRATVRPLIRALSSSALFPRQHVRLAPVF
jgi:hypothetical protein